MARTDSTNTSSRRMFLEFCYFCGRIYALADIRSQSSCGHPNLETILKPIELSVLAVMFSGLACAQPCDLNAYKPVDGIKAEATAGATQVTWQGERDQQLRAQFAIRDGQPLIQELAARKGQGTWIVLARNVTPEFEVTSGVRRMSEQQASPLRALKVELTPAVIAKEKWNAFWDAPLN